MFKYAVGLLLLLMIGFAGFVVWRTGLTKEIAISSGHQGPFFVVYQNHTGPYHQISVVIDQVEKDLATTSSGCPRAFGRYLDDPQRVDHDRLRSQGGCLFSQPLPTVALPPNYQSEIIPAREYIIATFNGSPSVGPWRVYPRVSRWMEKYGYQLSGPTIEIYQTLPDQTVLTTYLFPYQ